MDRFLDLIAVAAIILWPVIPIFWIPVHGFPRLFKRFGLFAYAFPAVVWTPLAWYLFTQANLLVALKFAFALPVRIAGVILLVLGILLQIWSGLALSLRGLMGMPEVSSRVESRFITAGPYRLIRHPTYLSHTMMFLGLFLSGGILAMGMVTFTDLMLITLVVIPLEDRELISRFGSDYEEYRKKVPALIPFGRRQEPS